MQTRRTTANIRRIATHAPRALLK